MNQEILDFLNSQRTGVFCIEMPDGSPHAATVHFANTDQPVFFFETSRSSKKAEALIGREASRASFVIGTSESNMQTLQMDGQARQIKPEQKEIFEQIYLSKFPEKKEKAAGSNALVFTFQPTWWRFTDWTKPKGKTIISSEDK